MGMELVLQVQAWDRRENVNWWWRWMEKVMESPKFGSIWDSLSEDTDRLPLVSHPLIPQLCSRCFIWNRAVGRQTDAFRFYSLNQGQSICSKSTRNHVQNAHFCLNLSLCLRWHGWRTLNVKKCLKSLAWYVVIPSICVPITGWHSWKTLWPWAPRACDLLNLDETKTAVWVPRFPGYDLTHGGTLVCYRTSSSFLSSSLLQAHQTSVERHLWALSPPRFPCFITITSVCKLLFDSVHVTLPGTNTPDIWFRKQFQTKCEEYLCVWTYPMVSAFLLRPSCSANNQESCHAMVTRPDWSQTLSSHYQHLVRQPTPQLSFPLCVWRVGVGGGRLLCVVGRLWDNFNLKDASMLRWLVWGLRLPEESCTEPQ